MRRFVPIVLCVVIAAAMSAMSGVCAAGTITLDPNTAPKAKAAASAPLADTRLDQRVTYQGGYRRLHAVADDLSKATGVTIRCGRDKADWHVRDIPIFVCVKGMELRSLLEVVAATSHTTLAADSRSAGEQDKPLVYRLYRSKKTSDEISQSLAMTKTAARRVAKWACDALASLPPVPDGSTDPVPADARLASLVLTALGADRREAMLDGQPILIRAKDVLPAGLIRRISEHFGASLAGGYDDMYRAVVPTQQELDKATICIKLTTLDRTRLHESLRFSVESLPVEAKPFSRSPNPPPEGQYTRPSRAWHPDLVQLAKGLVSLKDQHVPPPPDTDALLKANDPPPIQGVKALDNEENWKLPLVDVTFGLQLPQGRAYLTQADLLSALAQATGTNIICEDFASHMYRCALSANAGLGSNVTVKDVFKKLEEPRMGKDKMTWFVDEQRKLFIGRPQDWRVHHADLAPASVLENLSASIAVGADLDDLTPMFSLTDGQFGEWVRSGFEFPDIMLNMLAPERAVWRLYDSLSPADKALAKSDQGLPLAKFGETRLAGLIRQTQAEEDSHVVKNLLPEDTPAYWRSKDDLLTDAAFLSGSVMRVRSERLDAWSAVTFRNGRWPNREVYTAKPDGSRKHCYLIELTGWRNGKEAQISSKWEFMPFPVYTMEREAELRAEAGTGRAE